MTPILKCKQIGPAFDAGIDCLTRILTTAIHEAGNDELPNEIIEEKGI